MVWCDNISVVALACNSIYHACTKQIEIDAHFIHNQVDHKLVIQHIPSQD